MPRRLAQPRRAGQRLRVSCGDAVARGESPGWCRCGRALSSWGLNGCAILASGGATKSAMRGFAAPRLSSARGHPGFDPATPAEFRAQPKMSKRSSRMQHRVRNSKRARAVRDAPWREARLPWGPPANERWNADAIFRVRGSPPVRPSAGHLWRTNSSARPHGAALPLGGGKGRSAACDLLVVTHGSFPSPERSEWGATVFRVKRFWSAMAFCPGGWR